MAPNASKTVLDVGNCVPDHAAICRLVTSHFQAQVLQAHLPADTLETLRRQPVDLVLINRKLDQDYSDGMEILKQIKADAQLRQVPVMLVTNYADHQALAVAAGAEPGFGKLALDTPDTLEKLSRFLG
jgi:CheY-like chemotaxis protein